jgi:hypothetical protein
MRAESADNIRDGAYFDIGIGLGVESGPVIFDDRNASGLDYANALDDAPNSEIMLSYWPQSSLYSITLNSFVDLALPDEMLQTLKQNEVVVLETKKQHTVSLPSQKQKSNFGFRITVLIRSR